MNSFWFAFNAVIPIVLLILLGYFLKRIGLINDNFVKVGNKLVFNVLLPTLLFSNVYKIGSIGQIRWDIVLYAVLAILGIFVIGLVIVMFAVPDNRKKGVVLQCFFRSNFAIIGIPLAQKLGGQSALGIVSILSAFTIPLFGILAVISLTIFVPQQDETKPKISSILLNIAKNPLIIGVVVGFVALLIRMAIPVGADGQKVFTLAKNAPVIYTVIEDIAKTASPIALIVMGGEFSFTAVKGSVKEITLGTLGRLVVFPAICLGLAIILSKHTNIINFGISEYPALIALFGSPTAVSGAIMANQMDNDGQLASQLVFWTSVFSILSIFVIVVLLKSFALL